MIHREERKEDQKFWVIWATCDGCGLKSCETRLDPRLGNYYPHRPDTKDWGFFIPVLPPEGHVAENVADLCGACTKRVDTYIKALRSTK